MDNDQTRVSAVRLLRIIPEFNHWATARALKDRIGGDLSLRQLTALYMIRELRPSPGQLALELQVTPAVVTGIVDRLERRGFVQRSADAADRRRIRLTCTGAGETASLAAEAQLAGIIRQKLAAMELDQLAILDQGLSIIEEVLGALQRDSDHAASPG